MMMNMMMIIHEYDDNPPKIQKDYVGRIVISIGKTAIGTKK
jgi:hypothetical protein